jgi:hypothetical protein
MVAIKFKYEGVIKRVTFEPDQVQWTLLVETLRQIYNITSAEFLTWSFQLNPPATIRSENEFASIADKLKRERLVVCVLEQSLTLQDIVEKLLLVPANAEIVKGLLARYKACNPRADIDSLVSSPELRPSLSLTLSRIHAPPPLPSASQFRLVMHTEGGRQVLKAVPAASYTDYSTLHMDDLRASLSAKVLQQVLEPNEIPQETEEPDLLAELDSEESEGSDYDPLEEDARLLQDHDSDQELVVTP